MKLAVLAPMAGSEPSKDFGALSLGLTRFAVHTDLDGALFDILIDHGKTARGRADVARKLRDDLLLRSGLKQDCPPPRDFPTASSPHSALGDNVPAGGDTGMAGTQQIHELMARIGPILGLRQVTEYAEDAAWQLVFSDETQIDTEYDDANRRLVLTGNVAAVPEPVRTKAYEVLLAYTYLWTEHGGVRAALDASTGTVSLMLELPAAELDVSRLSAVLQNFCGVIEGWRGILASIAAGGDEAGAAGPISDMIRV